MPDASGRIRGTGWSRRAEAAFDRLRSNAALQQITQADIERRYLPPVPSEPPPEVWYDPENLWLADREAAYDDGWEADAQAARDGYNPAH